MRRTRDDEDERDEEAGDEDKRVNEDERMMRKIRQSCFKRQSMWHQDPTRLAQHMSQRALHNMPGK